MKIMLWWILASFGITVQPTLLFLTRKRLAIAQAHGDEDLVAVAEEHVIVEVISMLHSLTAVIVGGLGLRGDKHNDTMAWLLIFMLALKDTASVTRYYFLVRRLPHANH